MLRHITLFAIVCLIAVLGGVLLPHIKNGTVFSVLSPKPEGFTELYFEDHLYLPVTITPYSSYSFRFTVHNRNNREEAYAYRVWVEMDKKTVILDNRSVTIGPDEAKTIQGYLTTEKTVPKRGRVVVSLLDTHQHISFWMEAGR